MRKLIDSRHPVDNMLQDVHIYQEASFMVSEVSFFLQLGVQSMDMQKYMV